MVAKGPLMVAKGPLMVVKGPLMVANALIIGTYDGEAPS